MTRLHTLINTCCRNPLTQRHLLCRSLFMVQHLDSSITNDLAIHQNSIVVVIFSKSELTATKFIQLTSFDHSLLPRYYILILKHIRASILLRLIRWILCQGLSRCLLLNLLALLLLKLFCCCTALSSLLCDRWVEVTSWARLTLELNVLDRDFTFALRDGFLWHGCLHDLSIISVKTSFR